MHKQVSVFSFLSCIALVTICPTVAELQRNLYVCMYVALLGLIIDVPINLGKRMIWQEHTCFALVMRGGGGGG